MVTSLITAGVVAFAVVLFVMAFAWFLYWDDKRMKREERESEELDVPVRSQARVVMFRKPA